MTRDVNTFSIGINIPGDVWYLPRPLQRWKEISAMIISSEKLAPIQCLLNFCWNGCSSETYCTMPAFPKKRFVPKSLAHVSFSNVALLSLSEMCLGPQPAAQSKARCLLRPTLFCWAATYHLHIKTINSFANKKQRSLHFF